MSDVHSNIIVALLLVGCLRLYVAPTLTLQNTLSRREVQTRTRLAQFTAQCLSIQQEYD